MGRDYEIITWLRAREHWKNLLFCSVPYSYICFIEVVVYVRQEHLKINLGSAGSDIIK